MMRLCVFSAICTILLCSTALATGAPGQTTANERGRRLRVRKELRSLSSAEYRLLVQGLSTMLSVPTAEGQVIYGKQYKSYDYFIVKHAVAVNDPRGDQGHAGSCFMTFHRAWLLEFELALLSVVPGLKALPYWDLTLDNKDGKYYNTPNSIWSGKWAGSLDPTSDQGYAVKDGLLGWREVQHFNWAVYQEYAYIYNGSLTTGLLRSPSSTLNTTYVTRFPVSNLFEQGNVTMTMGDSSVPVPPNFNWEYTTADYIKCTDAAAYSNWTSWGYCIDITTVPQELLKQYMPPASSSLLHAGVHWAVGSLSLDGIMGDMFDVATSPNEVLLFFGHHANIDRNNMIWQVGMAARNPALVTPKAMYGYPATSAEYPYDVPGCYLDDVISANFNFTDIFGPSRVKLSGYTHREVLQNTRPNVNSPYTYDSMTK